MSLMERRRALMMATEKKPKILAIAFKAAEGRYLRLNNLQGIQRIEVDSLPFYTLPASPVNSGYITLTNQSGDKAIFNHGSAGEPRFFFEAMRDGTTFASGVYYGNRPAQSLNPFPFVFDTASNVFKTNNSHPPQVNAYNRSGSPAEGMVFDSFLLGKHLDYVRSNGMPCVAARLYDGSRNAIAILTAAFDPNGTPCFFDAVSNGYVYSTGAKPFGYVLSDGTVVYP